MGDETLPIKSSGLTKDDIALMVRELVLVTLPTKTPATFPNGYGVTAISPSRFSSAIRTIHKTIAAVCAWISLRQHGTADFILDRDRDTAPANPDLSLENPLPTSCGNSASRRMTAPASAASAHSVHRQLERLMHARIRFEQCQESDGGEAGAGLTCRLQRLVGYGGTPRKKNKKYSVMAISS